MSGVVNVGVVNVAQSNGLISRIVKNTIANNRQTIYLNILHQGHRKITTAGHL